TLFRSTVSGGTPTTMQINRGPQLTSYLATTGAIRIGIPQGYDRQYNKFGLPIEPAATNLLLSSEILSDAVIWPALSSGATVTANAIAAPDGATTADKLVESADLNFHFISQEDKAVVSGATYTFSAFAKAAERSVARLTFSNTAFTNVVIADFDLTNGNICFVDDQASAALTGVDMVFVGNGWYRCSVTGLVTTTGGL